MNLTPQLLQLSRYCGKALHELYEGRVTPNVVARNTDTQVLVEKIQDGRFAILFPGTASLRDVLTDINIPKVRWHSGYIHGGVCAAWRSVAEGVRAIVPRGADVIIGGHSLGAGLGKACADEIHGLVNVTQVITFGGLRTFNRRAAQSYRERLGDRTLRFVNYADPVPHLPLTLPIPRTGIYGHPPAEYYFNQDGTLVTGRSWYSRLRPLCRGLLAAADLQLAKAVTQLVSVSAHSQTTYNARLEGIKL